MLRSTDERLAQDKQTSSVSLAPVVRSGYAAGQGWWVETPTSVSAASGFEGLKPLSRLTGPLIHQVHVGLTGNENHGVELLFCSVVLLFCVIIVASCCCCCCCYSIAFVFVRSTCR